MAPTLTAAMRAGPGRVSHSADDRWEGLAGIATQILHSSRRRGLDHFAHDLERALDAGAVHVEVGDRANALCVEAGDLHACRTQILASLRGVLDLEHDDVRL